MIRDVALSDAGSISEIYNHYITHTTITCELEPALPEEMAGRVQKYLQVGPFLVYEQDGRVAGYASLSSFRERKAYQHSAESTIYREDGLGGRGIGYELYSEQLARAGARCHSIIGGIALPNPASIRLHEKCGFRKVAHFSEVGMKFGEWIDVGFWQRPGDWIYGRR
jgi:L-amino acid N-acyltransferase YncA